uniref:Uncharacterized protein n=1 Tax=Anguilla anguilla TaxID=7936 RepID=A0A0E9S4K9_ANGAN
MQMPFKLSFSFSLSLSLSLSWRFPQTQEVQNAGKA